MRRLLIFLGGLFLATQVLAHGTHARFISPDEGALVSTNLKVHIEKVRHPIPYVQIKVRNIATGYEKWAGLVPASDAGYVQAIDVAGWEAGSYVIETQFLGDIVEDTYRRSIVVGAPQ